MFAGFPRELRSSAVAVVRSPFFFLFWVANFFSSASESVWALIFFSLASSLEIWSSRVSICFLL